MATGTPWGDLIDLALEFTTNHKDCAGYVTKAKIVRHAMGSRIAKEVLSRDIEAFLTSHCSTAATHNRYKSFFSLCFRQGAPQRQGCSQPGPRCSEET